MASCFREAHDCNEVLDSEHLIHQRPNTVYVLIADLDEARPALMQKLPGEKEAVAQVGQVRVDAEFPSVAEGPDHLRLLGQVVVLAVLDVALVDEGLEVAAVADAIRRVDVDHLHLAGHAFLFEQGVHHQQGVARDQAVRPVVGVLVELDGLAQRRVLLGRLKQG